MGYKIKWIEDNLGITRKAIRCYEKAGVIPPNENRQYREFSEEQIETLWAIKVFNNVGYTLKEIAEGFDFDSTIGEKVEELEAKLAEVNRHLGYAKLIKLFGRLPIRPDKMGDLTFEEFYEQALNEWNINNDPHAVMVQDLINKPRKDWDEFDYDKSLVLMEDLNFPEILDEAILTELLFPKAIVRKIDLGADHPEVQLLVKEIYDNRIYIDPSMESMTKEQFARLNSSNYMAGDISKAKKEYFTNDECQFIADAFAIFGGYTGFDEI